MGFHNKTLATLACVHLLMGGGLIPLFRAQAAKPPRVAAKPGGDAAKVARSVFEGDVWRNLGSTERAREMYEKADPSGTCHPGLVSAYMATRGGAERLYLEMEAARHGNLDALRLALDRLYLKRTDPYAEPQAALDLYLHAKTANPRGTFEHEEAIAELLKMAAAPGAFDMRRFLEKHVPSDTGLGQSGEDEREPYLLWDLAERASVEGFLGKPDPELLLQLAARGTGELSERLSAVRAAFENWKHKQPGRFSCLAHLSSKQGVRHAVRRMLKDWEQDQKQRADALLSRSGGEHVGALLKQALVTARELAEVKSKYLHFHNLYPHEWQYTFFLLWDVERSLRLVDSVFSGLKPVVPLPPSQSLGSFRQWREAAESEVPAHLLEDGLPEGAGPCLAFSETDELNEVLLAAESCSEQLAKAFAQIHPGVSAEEWYSWLLTGVQREFDGSVPALERWIPAGTATGSPGEASLATGAQGGTLAPPTGDPKEQNLTSLRSRLNATETALFDSMRDAADAWFKRRASLATGQDGGAVFRDFTRAAQQTLLHELEPLVAGYVPSRVIPCRLLETLLDVQWKASHNPLSTGLEKGKDEAEAWREYRNRAGRFLAALSPVFSEEDWMGWLSEKRLLELPSSAFAYTEEERKRSQDQKYFAKEAESEADFRRIEAVIKDPRSMDLNLEGTQGLISSADGRLRIVSWDTDTGGSGHIYCAMAQFRSSDGRIGHAVFSGPDGVETTNVAIGGEVGKIDTLVTQKGETVYLVWSSQKGSTHRWTDRVAAVRLEGGRMERMPFFQTKRSLLSDISIEYGGEVADAGATLRLVGTKDHTLLVPVISDRYEFSGKFFRYVFDGMRFVFSGMQ
jgi:hypothetical protein